MNINDHLLIKLAEEGVEVALEFSKVTHKSLLFGLHETNVENPSGPDNQQRIVAELNDLMAIVELLVEHGLLPNEWHDPAAIQRKKEKVLRFAQHAREVGILERKDAQ